MAKERPTIRCSTEGLTRSEVIVHLFQAFRALKWGVEHLHPMRVVAVTPRSWASYGEEVTVELDENGFTASSKFVQWSLLAKRTRLNDALDKLREAFEHSRSTTSPELLTSELKELNESGVMELDASTARSNETSWKDFLLFFLPRKGFMATPILMDISLVVYLLMLFNGVHFMEPTVEDLLNWGGNLRAQTLGGEPWRLLTCCFVHIGLIHLLFNMYALLMIGIQLEPLLGSARLLALYVITGVVASMASSWWHENTVSAGASGAIFGLYGVFLALLFTDLIPKDTRKQLLQSIGIFVLYNLMYGLKGGIDNAAHIGGLLSGVALGFALYGALKKPEDRTIQWASVVVPSLLLFGGGSFALSKLPADDNRFYRLVEEFQVLEQRGLSPFRLPEHATRVQQLIQVQDSALSAWSEAVELLKGLDGMELSAALSERREQFQRYAALRLENMELLERALLRDDDAMSSELEASFARVDSILGVLNGTTGK